MRFPSLLLFTCPFYDVAKEPNNLSSLPDTIMQLEILLFSLSRWWFSSFDPFTKLIRKPGPRSNLKNKKKSEREINATVMKVVCKMLEEQSWSTYFLSAFITGIFILWRLQLFFTINQVILVFVYTRIHRYTYVHANLFMRVSTHGWNTEAWYGTHCTEVCAPLVDFAVCW